MIEDPGDQQVPHADGLPASVVPDGDVASQRVGDDVVVVHLRTNRIFVLNRTAARLWEHLQEAGSVAAAREQMLAEFAVDPDSFDRELREFLALLADERLVSVDDDS